jgi:hypothetical protein
LALSIPNKKDNAFIALLTSGANPNAFLGLSNDSTPLLCSIENQENCEVFYFENLLTHGADPNLSPIDTLRGSDNRYPIMRVISYNADNGEDCLNMVRLLVEHGADMKVCMQSEITEICEGVLTECLRFKSMQMLRYFVIEKRIDIPQIVAASWDKKYNLKEYLLTDKFKFESPGQQDYRKIRDEIIQFLDSKGQ